MTGDELAELPAPGSTIAGKYLVIRTIGKGGMGVVIEARHLRLGQNVALKLLLPSVRAKADIVERFDREARAAARLQGRHVARILDVDVLADGSPFMVMELLRGRELADELKSRRRLPITDAVGYILQACAGMAEAHRMGIIHRDLKPSNLFLNEHEGHRTVKVLDFGISKLVEEVPTSVTATGSAFGTPLYMSPEHVRSMKHVDARADIWSLGVVLFELLAGEPPFNHPVATAVLVSIATEPPTPLLSLRPEVPAPLAEAITRALEKDPEARFPDVRHFAAAIIPYGPPPDDPALADIISELATLRLESPILPDVTEEVETPPEVPPRKRRTVMIAAGLAAVVVFGAIFALVGPWSRPPIAPALDGSAAPAPPLPPQLPATTAPQVTPAPVPEESVAPLQPTAPVTTPIPSAGPRRKPITTAPQPTPPTTTAPPPTQPPDDPKYL